MNRDQIGWRGDGARRWDGGEGEATFKGVMCSDLPIKRMPNAQGCSGGQDGEGREGKREAAVASR